jgi:hypothetical protein
VIKGVKFVDTPRGDERKITPTVEQWNTLQQRVRDLTWDARMALSLAGAAIAVSILTLFVALH